MVASVVIRMGRTRSAPARSSDCSTDPPCSRSDSACYPPDEVDAPVGAPADEVAGAVQPPAAAERIGDEALGVELGPAQVTARDAQAADEELAENADRHRLAAAVDDVDLGVGDRLADGDGARVGGRVPRDGQRGGEGSALGRAVAIRPSA